MSETTPMMKQYIDIKKQNKDAILFFRLGDFYEMFRDDAVEVSRLLNLTLTKRHDIPMCGIPYHAAESYIGRLIKYGKKIAICEQVSLPVGGKGIAKREIVEVITPGTITNENYLDQKENNFLASLGLHRGVLSFAYADLSTGEFQVTTVPRERGLEYIRKELQRLNPKELILQENLTENIPGLNPVLQNRTTMVINRYPDWHFNLDSCRKTLEEHFQTVNLKAFDLTPDSPELISAGVLIDYLQDTSRSHLGHIRSLKVYGEQEYMILDESTQKNLELLRNLNSGDQNHTLIQVMDHTKTAMGGRLLRKWILSPLVSRDAIVQRQDRVLYFYQHQMILSTIREQFSKILDIERLSTRISMDKAHGKDLLSLWVSLDNLMSCEKTLEDFAAGKVFWSHNQEEIEAIRDLEELLKKGIHPEPSTLLTEGRLIREGYSPEVDQLRNLQNNAKAILNDYLKEQKEYTGISNLKLKYNKILGYFFEVSKANSQPLPEDFEKRQQLVNADRFVTPKLKELEENIHSAGDKLIQLEKEIFLQIRQRCKETIPQLQVVANKVAEADCYQSLAYLATRKGYSRPEISLTRESLIEDGRHPVVEEALPSGEFVPNNLNLHPEQKSFAMITGPNMAGKSTYLRQVALITLMAQIGSFVPASKAQIGIVDKIFCRVGASDNLARGESTFLVEMNETAHILRNSTSESLIIMDEVGRGTSTNDGLSIAWAVCEYIIDQIDAKTLFATHYHELTLLKNKKIQNLSMDVRETGDDIIFLKKIKRGAAGNSYGIHVAKLAGVPLEIVHRAQRILEELSSKEGSFSPPQTFKYQNQSSLFAPGEMITKELSGLNLDHITPIQALNLLDRWKKEYLS